MREDERRGGHGMSAIYRAGLVVAAAVIAAWTLTSVVGSLFGPAEPTARLSIVSGSENKALEPIVRAWADEAGVAVDVTYLGSVDISRELELGVDGRFDAVWPAHSLWIELGDQDRVVKHVKSVLRSPVALGLKRSIAEDLGWIGRDDVRVQDIQAAATSGRFRMAMTSATQSNSGASAYLGFLYAMAGDPDLLTTEMLDRTEVRDQVRALLAQVDRSSGSSGWLKEALVENPDRFDAMFNYEALIIEANQELANRRGAEPLYTIYPANGLAVSDSPFGFVFRAGAADNAAKEAAFLALQAHLLSSEVQDQLIAQGRRAGLIGLDLSRADRAVWNPDWGVDLARAIAPAPTPRQETIRRALSLYQTELRKPSLTVWALDVSGSMSGGPIDALKEAMRLLLDQRAAERALLQTGRRDVTVVIAFNDRIVGSWRVVGDDPQALLGLLAEVRRLEAGGGTDVYGALMQGLTILGGYHQDGELFDYLPAIVAMTDGKSDEVNRLRFEQALAAAPFGRDAPIHAIAFGDADEAQLEALTEATVGRLFRARDDLAGALRKAKGYN